MPAPDALRAAVADAGPLIHLDELDLLRILGGFAEVVVPTRVAEETTTHRSGWISRAPVTLRIQAVSQEAVARLVRSGRVQGLDPGEIEALALWHDNPVSVLLCDDLAARRAAVQLGCDVAGTVGLILWAARSGGLPTEQARSLLLALPERSSLHLRPSLLDRVVRQLDELG